ncbi:MAG: hypothetical protein PWP76_70 [Candidatus Diapherotrites archaeon]|nr:hypothetical protein [Candidatus Diapherotrites archaeon]MDN5366951.1 hypothetical protein [Candidatus Diapherotrites archaeon]
MKQNVGMVDRVVRAVVGLVALYFAYFEATGAWQIVLYVVAAVGIITALTGYCALYAVLGINTKK